MVAQIIIFLQTAMIPSFRRNHYHESLYNKYVLEEPAPAPRIPPFFQGTFFPTIRQLSQSQINLNKITLKEVYKFLLKDVLEEENEDVLSTPER